MLVCCMQRKVLSEVCSARCAYTISTIQSMDGATGPAIAVAAAAEQLLQFRPATEHRNSVASMACIFGVPCWCSQQHHRPVASHSMSYFRKKGKKTVFSFCCPAQRARTHTIALFVRAASTTSNQNAPHAPRLPHAIPSTGNRNILCSGR